MKSFNFFGTLLGGRLPRYMNISMFTIGVLCLFILPSSGIAQVNLNINNPGPVCQPATVDLTRQAITAGSSEGLVLTYWTDSSGTAAVVRPFSVGDGTYYIKGEDEEA